MRQVARRKLFCTFFGLLLFLLPELGSAGGYSLLEQSAKGVGVGFAGAAAGYGDGSEAFFNPAAMSNSEFDKTTISASAHLISSSAQFSNQGSSLSPALGGAPLIGESGPDGGDASFIPNFYVVHPLDDTVALGLGVNAPYGLATEYDRSWVGRYHAVDSELMMININPAASYKVTDNFSLGTALQVMYADATLSNMIDFGTIGVSTLGLPTASSLGLLPQAADGFGEVTGDDWGVGYTLGALYNYDNLGSRIGVAWHSKIDLTLTGDAYFEVPSSALPLTSLGAFTNTAASASVSLPDSAVVSLIHRFSNDVALLAEAQWWHWSRFEELRIKYDTVQPDTVVNEGWDNTWRFSIGSIFSVAEHTTLSAGFTFDQEPISDKYHRTPRIPGDDRYWFSLGASTAISETLTADLSYAHLFVGDAKSEVTGSTGDVFKGEWDLSVDIVSVGFTYRYS
ncbi:MAG: outer membrane protein transport protein [Bdellovibrionales bacterium]|nr:outer membrane protein transport protein [Bdellovibrionales bacterium]